MRGMKFSDRDILARNPAGETSVEGCTLHDVRKQTARFGVGNRINNFYGGIHHHVYTTERLSR